MPAELTVEQRQAIVDLTAAGHTVRGVSRILGCNPTTVTRWRVKLGVVSPPLPCDVDGCETVRTGGARGWCKKHWMRWRRYGSPVCRGCGVDAVHARGFCRPCADTADRRQRVRDDGRLGATRADRTCPHRCGRPPHTLPAIAHPDGTWPACPGTPKGPTT